MSLKSFDKGYFSSTAKLSLDFSEPGVKEEISKILKLPLTLDYSIENGPLFFKDGISFGASKISSNINFSKLFVDENGLKEIIKEDLIVQSSVRVDFMNNATYKGETNRLVADVDNDIFTISPLKLNGEMDLETFVGEFRLLSEKVTGELANGGKVKLENIILNGDITKFFENGFYLGKFDFAADKLNIDNPNLPQKVKNAKVYMSMNIDQDSSDTVNLDTDMRLDLGETEIPEAFNFGNKFTFNYGIDGMRLEAVLAFQDEMKKIEEEKTSILQKLTSATTAEEQAVALENLQNMQGTLEGKVKLLLSNFLVKDKTKLSVAASIVDNRDSKSHASLDMKYIGDAQLPKTLEELQAKFKKEILNWITLNVDMILQKSLVEKLPRDVQSQLSMAMMTGVVKDNNSTLEFNAIYVPKKLTINGEDKSSMIQLAEMSMQQ